MKLFTFYLIKYVNWTPRCKRINKTIEIKSNNLCDAYSKVKNDYAGWEISMFWPKSKIINGKYVHLEA
jgi:hypothetical protein